MHLKLCVTSVIPVQEPIIKLVHWCLVMLYGDIDLGQHWFRQWLVAWWHQAIAWTNDDLSSVRTISQKKPEWLITKFGLKITYRKVSNIRRTLVDNKIVYHSDIVGASPVGAAPTTSSFST